ncbi:Inorganic phosphate transporter PHO88 [Spraguea lophii 42_110]|uniref:Inorganic phosphate transporter PHO88 n=1 Tax=Spraguea lophii (strain 42_110) TaxID=1358809 RepID=S7XLG7_SPRLO|nr:Inorganic phosphate transporter PHO88 [Spraguea lophii 42_110]
MDNISLESVDKGINIILSLGGMQLAKRFDFQEPRNMMILRAIFFISQGFLFLMLYIINKKLNNKDERKVTVTKPKSMFEQQDSIEEVEEITYQEYDQRAFKSALSSSVIQFIIISLINFFMKSPLPLIIQSISVYKNLIFNPLFIAHIRNKEVLRPYEENKLFGVVKEEEKENKKRVKDE